MVDSARYAMYVGLSKAVITSRTFDAQLANSRIDPTPSGSGPATGDTLE